MVSVLADLAEPLGLVAPEQAVDPETPVVDQRPAEHVAVELVTADLGHAVATGEGVGELGRPRLTPGPAVELGEGTVAQADRLGRELGGAGGGRERGQEVHGLEGTTIGGGALRGSNDLGRGLGGAHGRHDTARWIAPRPGGWSRADG